MATLFCEISGFFNKDTRLAEKLVNEIMGYKDYRSEVEIVIKSEVMHTTNICIDSKYEDKYMLHDGSIATENYIEMLERKVLPLSVYYELFSMIKNKGLKLALSVYTSEGIQLAERVGSDYIKIASSNFKNFPLYEKAFRSSIENIIIDTGRVTTNDFSKEWVHYERLISKYSKKIIIEH